MTNAKPVVRRRPPAGGFTLIEVMVVVVILGVLASIAGVAYSRYLARARLTEAVTMLAEMSSRETLYQSEFASFLTLRADGVAAADESAAGFFPADPSSGTFDSVRTPTNVANQAAWPQAWRSVGLRARSSVLYCTYMVNAGTGATIPAGGFGVQLFPGAPATTWFYALAACNLSGASGYPVGATVMGLSNSSPNVITFNDGQ